MLKELTNPSLPASLEKFLLAWTSAQATPHTNFPQIAGLGRTNFIGIQVTII